MAFYGECMVWFKGCVKIPIGLGSKFGRIKKKLNQNYSLLNHTTFIEGRICALGPSRLPSGRKNFNWSGMKNFAN